MVKFMELVHQIIFRFQIKIFLLNNTINLKKFHFNHKFLKYKLDIIILYLLVKIDRKFMELDKILEIN